MKKIIFSLVDFFNIDSFISSYFRKSAFLIKLIPNSSFYNKTKIKKIRVNGIKFILEPSDLAQHILLKPDIVNTEMYGIQYLIKKALNYVGEKKLIFDIGANCGQFSLLATANLRQVYPDISFTIHSFEPNPYVFERLSRNIRENILIAQNIKCFNKGIGKERGTLQIQMPFRNSGAGSLLRNYQNEPHETHLVDIISLDEYIKEEKLANYDVCFLKIDVEGHGYEVLEGLGDKINKIKAIQIETESKVCFENQKVDADINKLLLDKGFALIDKKPCWDFQFDCIYVNRKL